MFDEPTVLPNASWRIDSSRRTKIERLIDEALSHDDSRGIGLDYFPTKRAVETRCRSTTIVSHRWSDSKGSPTTLGVGSPMRGVGSTTRAVVDRCGPWRNDGTCPSVPICRRSPLTPCSTPRSMANGLRAAGVLQRLRARRGRPLCRAATRVLDHHLLARNRAVAPPRRDAGVIEDGCDVFAPCRRWRRCLGSRSEATDYPMNDAGSHLGHSWASGRSHEHLDSGIARFSKVQAECLSVNRLLYTFEND